METNKSFEERALEQLDYMQRFAAKLTVNKEEAQDLVQETYLKAFKYQKSFKLGNDHQFRGWMSLILYNQFINDYRRYSRYEKGRRVDTEDWKKVEKYFHHEESPAYIFNLAELQRAITSAISALPEPYKAMAKLKFEEHMEYKEMGGHLGICEGTVKSQLHRGCLILKDRLKKYGKAYGLKGNGYVRRQTT